jgi:hypothetical protein
MVGRRQHSELMAVDGVVGEEVLHLARQDNQGKTQQISNTQDKP